MRSPADEAHGPPVPFSSWAVELVRLLGGLAAPTPRRRRHRRPHCEQMIVAMSDLSGRPMTAWCCDLARLPRRPRRRRGARPVVRLRRGMCGGGSTARHDTLDAVYPPLLVASVRHVATHRPDAEAEDAGRRVIDLRPRPGGGYGASCATVR
ncbi:MAG: hypothetical protein R2699_18675 [Acidimicrobiales bacterium]